jgi:DnaJ-class molecular chaperone
MSKDFYKLLQITPNATNAQIKAAYRRFAKIYHPDKNPFSEEKFKQIKEAYETLIDPDKRIKYDLKRNYNIRLNTTYAKQSQQPKKQKVYTFSEKDLKYRSYYQEHYKTKPSGFTKASAKKNSYKELTYILISIPIAVALLILLVRLYEIPKKDTKNLIKQKDTTLINQQLH